MEYNRLEQNALDFITKNNDYRRKNKKLFDQFQVSKEELGLKEVEVRRREIIDKLSPYRSANKVQAVQLHERDLGNFLSVKEQ